MTELAAYLMCFTAIAASVWAAIKGFDRLTGWSERKSAGIAVALGLIGGIICQWVGFVKTPGEGALAGYVSAGFFGLLASLAGAGATDLNLASLVKKDTP